MGVGVRVRGQTVQKAVIEGVLKIMSDLSLLCRGNVSGCFIFIKTRVREHILIRG